MYIIKGANTKLPMDTNVNNHLLKFKLLSSFLVLGVLETFLYYYLEVLLDYGGCKSKFAVESFLGSAVRR